ncbi:MAG: OmpA family protein [Pseudomonadota bacterium]
MACISLRAARALAIVPAIVMALATAASADQLRKGVAGVSAVELPVDAGYCAIFRALTSRIPAECPSVKAGSQARSIVPRTILTTDVEALTTQPADAFSSLQSDATQGGQPVEPRTAMVVEQEAVNTVAQRVSRSLRYDTAAVQADGRGDGAGAYFIHFAFDSADIGQDYRSHLDSLAKVLQTSLLERTCLRVVGHTDSVGSADYNLMLSERRADMVRDYLVMAGGIPETRILMQGSGEQVPLGGVDPMHPQNRRVEFQIRETTGGC